MWPVYCTVLYVLFSTPVCSDFKHFGGNLCETHCLNVVKPLDPHLSLAFGSFVGY